MSESVTAPAGHEPEVIARHLDKAAAHMDAVGLHKRTYYDKAQLLAGTPLHKCRVCASGAITFAILGIPYPEGMTADQTRERRQAGEAVSDHLEQLGHSALIDYNDDPSRTAEQVTAALRATAARLRSGELPLPD